jgi:C-terminal processing protease CtpA/Prc
LLLAGALVVLLAVLLGSAFVSPSAEHVDVPPPDEVENLRAFAKLYGYVRYFHPSDAASAVDWERFAVYGAREVRDAPSPAALRARLAALFGSIAPTVQIYSSDAPPPAPLPVLVPDDTAGLDLVAWQHLGVGLGNAGPYRSVRLHRAAQAVETGPGFGSLGQNLDAAPHRGRQIRLEAALKTDVRGTGNQAQLWLRVDRPDGQRGFFDNMIDRPVTATTWGTYGIEGYIADDAERIAFGAFLFGEGRAWLDAVRLLVRENDADEWTPVPIENAGFETGEAGAVPEPWGTGARGYRFETTEADAFEGDRSLVIASPEPEPEEPAEPLFERRPAPGEAVEKLLGRGLVAHVPLALYSRNGQTLRPDNAPRPDALDAALEKIVLDSLTADYPPLRYADVIIAWNVFQHFYPYFDVVDADWDAVLTEALRRAASDEDAVDFLTTLRWMVAQLGDGHVSIWYPVEAEQAGLPLLVEEIEGEVVIVAVSESADACFERGDVVARLDGVPANKIIADTKPLISGSPQWKTVRALGLFGRGERGTMASLGLRRPSGTVTCEVVRDIDGRLGEERPETIEEVSAGVHYVDLDRAEMADLRAMAPTLAEAKGIVFDLRGYPNGNHDVLRHLTREPLRSAQWQVPQQIYPDREGLIGYDTTGRWTLPPAEPTFPGEIVFLTDGRAISYAESVLGIVEHYGLGVIVGQPTAGANGNTNPFTMPGGYRLSWTGMRVLKHDGSQHHLVGIRPTIPAERTIAGVRAGRDELLEKALDVIERAEPTSPR